MLVALVERMKSNRYGHVSNLDGGSYLRHHCWLEVWRCEAVDAKLKCKAQGWSEE